MKRKAKGLTFLGILPLLLASATLLLVVWMLGSRAALAQAPGDALRTPVLTAPAQANVNLSALPPPLKHDKISSRLLAVAQSYAASGDGWLGALDTTGLMISPKGQLLVEVSFNPSATDSVRSHLERLGTDLRHHNSPGLFEAWLPVGAMISAVAHKDLHFIRPARLARPEIGSSLSQGVAASNVDLLHAAGIDGSGVLIANIDGGYTDYALRQASGDWPSGAAITTFDIDGGGFGFNTPHGTATLEINYDMAPGANFLAYEISTRGDWYSALISASVQGADIASVSLGMPLDGIGDGTALPGSIAEASGIARAAGMLVVNAAGNERDNHWGGLYNDSVGTPGTHDWGSGGNLLTTGGFCYSTSSPRFIELYWDDWTNVDHDYDLYLYQLRPNGTTWAQVDSSTNTQNGGAGQTPQESIAYLPTFHSGGCGVGFGYFGVLVSAASAATDRNLQLFLDYTPSITVPARSLGFPADSPNVFTMAAIDVTSSAQEVYSSEGPVLGPGGSLAASSISKPDGASFANVDTEAYGPGLFNGTSSATPHAAGLAALLLQNDHSLTVSQLEDELRNLGLSGSNDLGAAGFDTLFGYGRVRVPDADMSDLADSYGVAWHAEPTGGFTRQLGASNDTDSTAADGSDDAADDGVIRSGSWVQGQATSLDVTVTGGSGHLVGWVDWSGNGDFLDAGEEVINQSVSAGANVVGLTVPGTYTTGTTVQVRFRLYSSAPLNPRPKGPASDGEVEDYSWAFTPTAIALQTAEAGGTGLPSGLASWLIAALLLVSGAALLGKKRAQRASRSQRSMAS